MCQLQRICTSASDGGIVVALTVPFCFSFVQLFSKNSDLWGLFHDC